MRWEILDDENGTKGNTPGFPDGWAQAAQERRELLRRNAKDSLHALAKQWRESLVDFARCMGVFWLYGVAPFYGIAVVWHYCLVYWGAPPPPENQWFLSGLCAGVTWALPGCFGTSWSAGL